MDQVALIAVALLLVLVNGFFVAAEFAIVKLRQTRAEDLARHHGLRGKLLLSVRGHLDAYLSACQLGITLASIGLGWIGEPAFAQLLGPAFRALGIVSPQLIDGIAFGAAYTVISFLHIVIGELAPKSMAIRHAESVSLWTAAPLFAFYWLMYPFIRVLNGSAFLLLRALGMELAPDHDDPFSPEEIRKVLAASHRHGELSASEARLLSQALELGEIRVGELMQPSASLVFLDGRLGLQANLELMAETKFSRYPFCDGGLDGVLGVVHAKDVLAALIGQPKLEDLRPLLREALVTTRQMPAARMFRRFSRGVPHLALVHDELGTVIGFLTMNHIQEAVLGRVRDEFHHGPEQWRETAAGFEGQGSLSLLSLERRAGIPLPADDEVDTIGGLVMKALDRVPRTGDCIEFEGFSVEILRMHGPRIEKLRVRVQGSAPSVSA